MTQHHVFHAPDRLLSHAWVACTGDMDPYFEVRMFRSHPMVFGRCLVFRLCLVVGRWSLAVGLLV